MFRCTTCVAWAACGSCAAVCRLPLRDRAAAADAHPGWHPAPPGGPCACCGARASALWRRGAPAPAAPALFCAACCALAVPGAAPACPPVEVHDGGTHAVVAHPTAAGGGAGGGAHPAADPAEPLACGPLRDVVLSATRRWFCDALRAAKQGDGGSMELVAWEYAEGYGCARDAELARFWRQAAREHGARRIEGVYDELD